MNPKIKEILLLLCALGALALVPLFISQGGTIQTDMPELTAQMLSENAQQDQKVVRQNAEKKKSRQVLECQADDECIIVDKDPCGCLVGPDGVTAINASFTFEFNKEMASVMAKACPETAASQEKECSPSAKAVCQENLCKIVY